MFDFLGQTWNFEVLLQCSPPPPRQAPTFFFFLFFFFFHANLESQTSMFLWNYETRLQSSNLELGTSLGTPWSGASSPLLHPFLHLG